MPLNTTTINSPLRGSLSNTNSLLMASRITLEASSDIFRLLLGAIPVNAIDLVFQRRDYSDGAGVCEIVVASGFMSNLRALDDQGEQLLGQLCHIAGQFTFTGVDADFESLVEIRRAHLGIDVLNAAIIEAEAKGVA